MSATPDQRQYPRVPIAYRVKVVTPERIIAFPSAINISMGGILIGGPDRLPVGTTCGVAILLEEAEAGRRVVTRGTVVRSDPNGMAIQFSRELEPNGVEALRALIRSVSPEADQAFEARNHLGG
ncbi:PilZ domain-containing protein [Geothrix terrae]|uniref:PilZ domain-containing protein n=1 Tax=Geothrix terrae TaxID=2922720 RepID=UPI001FAC8E29|nr:PilZ domain-containing protein [Geothrix terrae]